MQAGHGSRLRLFLSVSERNSVEDGANHVCKSLGLLLNNLKVRVGKHFSGAGVGGCHVPSVPHLQLW